MTETWEKIDPTAVKHVIIPEHREMVHTGNRLFIIGLAMMVFGFPVALTYYTYYRYHLEIYGAILSSIGLGFTVASILIDAKLKRYTLLRTTPSYKIEATKE